MTEQKKQPPVFSKQSIEAKQEEAMKQYEEKVHEMRQTFERIAGTEDGMKLFRYLFLLSGGDKSSVRRDKEGNIDTEDTLLTLGSKSVYETLKFNLTSETIMKIERHDWEK